MGFHVLYEIETFTRLGCLRYRKRRIPPGARLGCVSARKMAGEIVVIVEFDPGDAWIEREPGWTVAIQGINFDVPASGT